MPHAGVAAIIVSLRLGAQVDAAVDLNHNPVRIDHEVRNEVADGLLTAQIDIVGLESLQKCVVHQQFCLSGIPPHVVGVTFKLPTVPHRVKDITRLKISIVNRSKRTDRTRARFLNFLEQTCNVSKACELANLPRQTAYEWRDADGDFKLAWEKAIVRASDLLEEEAVRRALEGFDEPVYQGGKMVGVVRKYSDTLMCLLLKGAKKDKYGDRTTIAGDPAQPLRHQVDGSELIERIMGITSKPTK